MAQIMPLHADGTLSDISFKYDPKHGRKMKAKADSHVNHSRNDAAAQAERQGDPHSHAIVLDPYEGCIAYVPDLACGGGGRRRSGQPVVRLSLQSPSPSRAYA